MKKHLLFWLVCFTVVYLQATEVCSSCKTLLFKENKNQWNTKVLFNADMKGGNILLEKNAITYTLFSLEDLARIRGDQHHQHTYKPDFDKTFHCHAFKVSFINANSNCKATGANAATEYFNYFIGNDKSKWASRVRGFKDIIYSELYAGIDLNVYSSNANMKYDFIVKPGKDIAQIKLKYEGVDALEIKDGALHITTSLGQAIEQPPYTYQVINGVKKEVACAYVLQGNELSFSLPNGYNKQYELVIDPTLIFSTFSGSFADNFGYSATYDSRKNAYAAGSVFINQPMGGYPTTLGAYQTTWAGGSGAGTLSGTDIGITKYSADGSTRIYSTYLGGVSDELPHSLIVNGNDELFIFGTTSSSNFPVTNAAYDATFNGGPDPSAFNGLGVHYEFGSDIIISRISSDGTQLLASTYVGGTGNDGVNIATNSLEYNYADQVRGEIDIDEQNNVYVVTCSGSADFPIVGSPFQPTYGGGRLDGVVIKMNNNLTTIIWSSYIGGASDDAAYSLSIDKNDDLFIAGGTNSTNFPVTAGTIQQTNGGGRCDGFVTHISKTGQQILQSSYFGYSDYDQTYFIEANKKNEVFLLGQAETSDSFYIKNAAYNVANGGIYITKLGFELDTIIWSTSLGQPNGVPSISPTAFLVDLCNKVYVAGWGGVVNGFGGTSGLPFTPDAYQKTTDNSDFYLMVMEDDASALSYATYFGGPISAEHVDGGTSRFDKGGVVYQSVCAGCGNNDDFPTTAGAVSNTNNSPNCNNAVFKFDFNLPIVLADFKSTTACAGFSLTLENTSTATANATYTWNFGDGTPSSSQTNPQHTFTQSGLYTVTLIVSDPGTCNFGDTIQKQILVLSSLGVDTIPAITICQAQSVQIGLPPSNDSAITYLWSPANSLSEITVSNPFASPTQSTLYVLLVSNGVCTDTFVQEVTIFKDALSLAGNDLLCAGDTLQLSVVNSEPNQQLNYSWQPVAQIISGSNTATPLVSPIQTTTFTVTVTNAIGCVFSDSIVINILSTLPSVNAFATPDTIVFGDTAQLNVTLSNNVSTFAWAPDATISATNIQNPVAYPKVDNTYYIQVADSQGCSKTDSVRIIVVRTPCEESSIYIPTGFSPNNDGKNDVLYVRGNYITKLYFALYDRWGQLVFETTDITKGWDGTFKGKRIDPAVFGYYLEGLCEGGEPFFKKGNITLLR